MARKIESLSDLSAGEVIRRLYAFSDDEHLQAVDQVLRRAGILIDCKECGWTSENYIECDHCGADLKKKYD